MNKIYAIVLINLYNYR